MLNTILNSALANVWQLKTWIIHVWGIIWVLLHAILHSFTHHYIICFVTRGTQCFIHNFELMGPGTHTHPSWWLEKWAVGFYQTCSNMHLLIVYGSNFRSFTVFSGLWIMHHFHHWFIFLIPITEFTESGYLSREKCWVRCFLLFIIQNIAEIPCSAENEKEN